jgi:HAD superfamily hydrolase (TIGR01490 family)
MSYEKFNKIAIVDVDGTLTKGQVQQGLFRFLFKKGELNFWIFLKLNVWFLLYKLHIVDDVQVVFRMAMENFRGEDVLKLDELVKEYVQEHIRLNLFPHSKDLINNLHKDGYFILFLSTAVNPVIEKIAHMLNADDYICTELEIKDHKYTGNPVGEIVYGSAKSRALTKYIENTQFKLNSAVAYADHLSDVPLLKMVGNGYLVNPDERLKSVALTEGLGIIYTS